MQNEVTRRNREKEFLARVAAVIKPVVSEAITTWSNDFVEKNCEPHKKETQSNSKAIEFLKGRLGGGNGNGKISITAVGKLFGQVLVIVIIGILSFFQYRTIAATNKVEQKTVQDEEKVMRQLELLQREIEMLSGMYL